jgi:hypothetical protein
MASVEEVQELKMVYILIFWNSALQIGMKKHKVIKEF